MTRRRGIRGRLAFFGHPFFVSFREFLFGGKFSPVFAGIGWSCSRTSFCILDQAEEDVCLDDSSEPHLDQTAADSR
jgi:hypothetical protein